MTRVALYARYSSDHQKDSSITDQFRNCEQRAAREGWTITARYEDKAISGATAERPGYQQMLKDAKAKQFEVLLVDDFSRLSRDSIETETARRRLVHWGVRLIGVSDGIDTQHEGHELLSGFKGIMNQNSNTELRKRIKRGMIGQAAKQYWQGGRVYGYKLVPVLDPTKTDPYGQPKRIGTRLEVDPEQATWVRWIFERYAEGQSPIKIVTELNRRGIAPPGAAFRRAYPRTPSWGALALYGELYRGTGLLNNNLYRGVYIWNRSRREKDPETHRRAFVVRDRSEWIETAMPHLRIVDDALWARVQARRVAVSQGVAVLRAVQSRAHSTGRDPKYLFSGLLVCGVCGGRFVICDRDAVRLQPAAHAGRVGLREHAPGPARAGGNAPAGRDPARPVHRGRPRGVHTGSGAAARRAPTDEEAGPGAGHRATPGRRAGNRPHHDGDQGGHLHAEHQGGAGTSRGRAGAVAPDGAGLDTRASTRWRRSSRTWWSGSNGWWRTWPP